MGPIILRPPSHNGVPTIPSSYATPRPYERAQTLPWTHVPSLTYFCIRRLVDYPEYAGRVSLPYVPPETEGDHDILRTLIPSYSYFDNTLDYNALDPRLWAVIVQVFTGLPSCLSTYSLALSDRHLPLLQRVECTESFSLIVVLDLSGSPFLRDETIHKLLELRHLAALDIGKTRVSALGVRLLRPRTGVADGHEGPRALRVLSLRGCKTVDDEVLGYLLLFPLLSAIDIRDTACSGRLPKNGGFPFSPCDNARLFHPTPDDLILANLQTEQPELHSSTNVYTLSVAQERYPASQPSRTADELRDHGSDARDSPSALAGEDDAPEAMDQLQDPSCASLATDVSEIYEKDQMKPSSDDVDSLLGAPEVARDSREFASRLDARHFYSVPNARPRHRPSKWSHHFSARYRLESSTKHRPEIQDPRFTLYRPPPPYSSLTSYVSLLKSAGKSRSSVASDKRSRLDPALISSNKDAVSRAAQAFLVSRKRPRLDAGAAWGMPTAVVGGQVGGQAAVVGDQAAAAGGFPASTQGSTMLTQSAKATSLTPATKKANPFAAKHGGCSPRLEASSSQLGASSSSHPKAPFSSRLEVFFSPRPNASFSSHLHGSSSSSSSPSHPSSSTSSNPPPLKPSKPSPPKPSNPAPPKPLMPISALPRPDFPPDEVAKNLKEGQKAQKARERQKAKEKGEKEEKNYNGQEKKFDWTNWSRRGG